MMNGLMLDPRALNRTEFPRLNNSAHKAANSASPLDRIALRESSFRHFSCMGLQPDLTSDSARESLEMQANHFAVTKSVSCSGLLRMSHFVQGMLGLRHRLVKRGCFDDVSAALETVSPRRQSTIGSSGSVTPEAKETLWESVAES
jgi:hypothetical protein